MKKTHIKIIMLITFILSVIISSVNVFGFVGNFDSSAFKSFPTFKWTIPTKTPRVTRTPSATKTPSTTTSKITTPPTMTPTATPKTTVSPTVIPSPSNTPGGNDLQREASKNPPNALAVSSVPQFIVFGFDDNYSSDGVKAIVELFEKYNNPAGIGKLSTYDGMKIRSTFYNTGKFIDSNDELKTQWANAYNKGFEVGDHTYAHDDGKNFTYKQWSDELTKSEQILKNLLGNSFKSYGFRSPYLSFNQDGLQAVKDYGFEYDCSIPEGDQSDVDGKGCYWPYTLDNGSPCNKYVNKNWNEPLVTGVKGLWEIPAYTFTVPSDNDCSQYGVDSGLRSRMEQASSDFNFDSGKVTGMDWNVFEKYKANPKEYTAILKYSLDLRLNGNRAPMTIGSHSNFYSDSEYSAALEEFITYALKNKDVRIVTAKQLLDWLKNPVVLK